MCKYCESKRGVRILDYNNADSMNIAYGQYQGVSVDADITMIGNMLLLSGSGSYRSKSDCYYEDWGLDCDSEHSINSKGAYIKIEFCPFCGKKINSTLYEKTYFKDQIEKLEKKLKQLDIDLSFYSPVITFIWKNPNSKKQWNNEDTDFTINELLEKFKNVKCEISYYSYYYTRSYHSRYSFYDLDTKIKLNWGDYKNEYSTSYLVDNKVAKQLADIGVLEYNEKKWKDTLNKLQDVQDKIKKTKEKLSECKEELKKYKK